jgi:hypothetical protein
LITPEIEPELFAYVGGILKNNESRLLDAGGTFDHVHLLISQSKNIALSSFNEGCEERQLFMDKDKRKRIQKLSLARWGWGLFNQ